MKKIEHQIYDGVCAYPDIENKKGLNMDMQCPRRGYTAEKTIGKQQEL